MPDLPITGLTALTTVPDDDFPLPIVDKTDLTQSPQGTTKKVDRGVLLGGILPLRIPVKNNSGVSTLTKGTLLMAVSALGDRVLVDPAVTDGSVNAIYIVGVAAENIGPGADGYAESYTELRNMNTLAYPVGTILWNNPAVPGGVTTVQPTAPNLKIPVAIVTRQNAASGRWFVRETPFPNLGDLSNVNAPTPTDGQVLAWNNANLRWESATLPDKSAIKLSVTQVAHGFAVGEAVRFNGSQWVAAQASTEANGRALGIVESVPGASTFTVVLQGYISGLAGLNPGSLYYLSAASPGALTTTAPAGGSTVVKPLLLALSASTGIIANWLGYLGGGTGSGDSAAETITQNSHGFAVGDIIRHNGTIYVKAQADTAANAEAIGVVSAVPSINSFTVVYGGRINGLSGLTAGEVYFLSSSVAGGSTITQPTISKPMFVATSTTSAVVVNYRGLTGGGGGGGGGSTNVWIPASEWIPRTTNGCGINSLESATNKINYDVLEFDPAAIEYAQAMVVMPTNWNAGTVTAKFHWTAASGSGDVVWQLSGRAYANGDAIDAATGTPQTSTDTLTAANDVDISPATSAITLAGTPANGNPVIFELSRKATDAGDTLAVDARLFGVEITYTAA